MSYENGGQPLFRVHNGRDLHTTSSCHPLIQLFSQERNRLEFPVIISDIAHFV